MSNKNNDTISNFKTYTNPEPKHSNFSFGRNVLVPFVSGVTGCVLVIGLCLGVPEIKDKLVKNLDLNTASSTNISGTVPQVQLSSFSDTAIKAANKILPSIVGIEVTYSVNNPYAQFFGGSSTQQAKASGSGIIISDDGYILTNNHIVSSQSSSSNSYYTVSEASEVVIKLYNDETEYKGTIVGKDEQTDLAVIKIDKTGLTKATFADSDNVRVGEFALAAGNPLGLESTITVGVVSAVNRKVESDGKTFTLIQTDAAINAGNSGGALVNSEGDVIGVNTLKLSGSGIEGMGFAIPINSTINIVEQLIEFNKVKRPYIGISGVDVTEELAKANKIPVGIYIKEIRDFSPAQKSGLKIGDVITKVDGKEMKTIQELNEYKNTKQIGDVLKLTIDRDGKTQDIDLTLGEQ